MKLLIGLLLLFSTSVFGQTNLIITVTNLAGNVLSNVKVVKVLDDGIIYLRKDGAGGGKLKFSDMPDGLRQKFGDSPEKAAKAIADQKANDDNAKFWANEAVKYNAVLAQNQAVRDSTLNGERMVVGKVLQKVEGGLLVNSGQEHIDRETSPHMSGKAFVYGGHLEEGTQRGTVCLGLVLLQDHPQFATITDDAYVSVKAYPCGQYTYTTVQGATKTVRKFSVNYEKAVMHNITH